MWIESKNYSVNGCGIDVALCNCIDHFNSFWTTIEHYSTEEKEM